MCGFTRAGFIGGNSCIHCSVTGVAAQTLALPQFRCGLHLASGVSRGDGGSVNLVETNDTEQGDQDHCCLLPLLGLDVFFALDVGDDLLVKCFDFFGLHC